MCTNDVGELDHSIDPLDDFDDYVTKNGVNHAQYRMMKLSGEHSTY